MTDELPKVSESVVEQVSVSRTVARSVSLSEEAKPLYLKVKNLFGKTLDHKNVLKFVELTMELIDLERDLSGTQKKALVIAVVKYAVADLIPDDDEYVLVEHFVKHFIDQTIDEIVEVHGGKLTLNVRKSRCYCSCLDGLFGKKKK
jgi:hypothetical protein